MTSVFILKTHECCEINTNQRKIIKIDEDDLSVFRRATEDHKQKLRMWNIIVHGAPPKPTLEEEVLWIARELGLFNDWEYDIVGFYRLNSTSKPLVMQMRDSTVKLKWLLEYREKKLWNKRLYMNEHLTLYNLQLFGKCKEWAKANKYKHVSVNDCKIYIQRLHPNDPRGVNDSQYEATTDAFRYDYDYDDDDDDDDDDDEINTNGRKIIRIDEDDLTMHERVYHDYGQRLRMGNILVHGLLSANATLREEVIWLARRLRLFKDWEHDVLDFYRLNGTATGKPLILVMKNNIIKQKWLHQYRKVKLWTERLYMNEHLTTYNFNLYNACKRWVKANGYGCVLIKDCSLYIGKWKTKDPRSVNDTLYEVKSFKALESIPSLNSN
ncbi:hypothetical protein WDU94_008007 [Cyamophila willieti]